MYQRILVPVDGSETSNRGLDEAIQLAGLTGGRIRLVHGIDSLIFSTGLDLANGDLVGVLVDSGAQILCEAKARVEASGLAVDTYFPETLGGRICDMVVEQAKLWHADLIVIGTHGRRGVGRVLMGSDAEQIVRAAPVPVLLVRPKPAGAGLETSASSEATGSSTP